MKRIKYVAAMMFSLMLWVSVAQAAIPSKVEEAVRTYINEKIKITSTVDIYDAGIDKVRNLRLLEILPDLKNENDAQIVTLNFRDINSGDVVLVKAIVKESAGAFSVASFDIAGVTALAKAAAADPAKEFSQSDIEAVITEYITKKSKFTKTFDLFDEKKQGFRHLEFSAFEGELRRFGVLNILRAAMKDTESSEILKLDFTVENKAGVLSVTTVKVFEIKKQ